MGATVVPRVPRFDPKGTDLWSPRVGIPAGCLQRPILSKTDLTERTARSCKSFAQGGWGRFQPITIPTARMKRVYNIASP